MIEQNENVTGVILAGGLARRMGGGDKCLLEIGGVPLLTHCLVRLAPQVKTITINANGNPERFAPFEYPVVADTINDYAGPLAGVLAGMRWAQKQAPGNRHIVTVASDTPFFPRDLVSRLTVATDGHPDAIALAASNGRLHPVFGLWPLSLADDLERSLDAGMRKILAWTDMHKMVEVPFEVHARGGEELDPFFNVNRPEDLRRAEKFAEAVPCANRA